MKKKNKYKIEKHTELIKEIKNDMVVDIILSGGGMILYLDKNESDETILIETITGDE